jgi:hypothetical protein
MIFQNTDFENVPKEYNTKMILQYFRNDLLEKAFLPIFAILKKGRVP